MSFEDDLQSFLEARLIAYDPAVDLSANSPAQLQIIQPTIARFGEDPFSTDIPTFIQDRLTQEYPDLAANSAGAAEDILAKPMQLLLEPFKREIQAVKIGSSVQNAAIMSEAEADALGANWFEDRNQGDYSSGLVRLYFAQPTTALVTADKLASTNDGLGFFPIQTYQLTVGQMAFNRQGSFYFMDILVRAENPGDQYNVAKGDINSIEGVAGVVKVANLTDFISGDPKETNEEYLGRVENSLTDRSLVVKRGILARVPNDFDSVRALQIIGAGEAGMNRDILTGTGQGFLHLAGKAVIYGDWIWISEVTYRDDGPTDSITPQPGDTIRFHLTSPAPPATDVVEAQIVSILSSNSNLYLMLLDHSPYNTGNTRLGAFALLKPGVITISGVPGGIAADIEVADNTAHLGGHTDVFVRPTEDIEVQSTITNVTDDQPIVAMTDLAVIATASQNLVQSTHSDFIELGVLPQDLLIIDTGAGFAGTYQILEVVDSHNLRLSSVFALTATDLRARVVRNIRVDLIAPKVPKLPYTNSPVSDLQTNVGSNEFRFATINIQDFNAKLGDKVNVLEGPDAGEFTITSFGSVAGSVFVDRVASATGANLSYEVYTKQDGLLRPLIRLKGIEVLDSTGQTTGITVPYGDAVDIRPESNFETAGHEKTTYDKQLIVFPDMPEWSSGGLADDHITLVSINDTTDARYTLGLGIADGVIRQITNNASNQIHTTEINVPPFIWNGRRDKLLALVSRNDTAFPSSIAGTHKTSDIAEAKIGDSITINDGPNQGKYVILDLRILDLWGKSDVGHRKVALIQVDPPLPVDPIRTALSLINTVHGSQFFSASDLFGFLSYAADWDNGSGFYQTFLTQLRSNLTTDLSIPGFSSNADLQAFFDPLIRSSYSVGPSAAGIFRTYFLEPVSAEFYFDEDPTTFTLASDGSKSFRVDPSLDPAQVLPESVTPTKPSLWNRDLGIQDPQDTYAYVTDGASFPVRGVRAGDLLEFYPAVNDLPARGSMTSSWMCVTQAGSNVIQLIMPQSNNTQEAGYGGADNFADLVAGQLFFIDSGPDIGAYVVTKVLKNDWVSNPPVLQIQLDQPLTFTTDTFPVLSTAATPPTQADFSSALPAYVQGTDLTFPLTLNAKHLKVKVSTDGGTSYTAYTHTFAAGDPYADMPSVIADIAADSGFIAGVTPGFNGSDLVLTSVATGPRVRLQIDATVSAPSAHTLLGLTNGVTGAGVRGAATLPGTARIYGTGLNQCLVNDWITIYAANSPDVLTAGDDAAIVGTYQISAVGTDTTTVWAAASTYVELDRSDSFPTGLPVAIRWIRHESPDQTPQSTSGGGQEISDQFVRFRMYDTVSKDLAVADIPWSSNPLDASSTEQIQLASPGIIDTAHGQRNFAHKAPYRILRPGVLRISSTDMQNNREGALYYLDVPVVGYGPGADMNVTPDDGFVLSGTSKIEGYTLEVSDEIFTYSSQEQLHLVLPNSVLPVGSTSELDNLFNLSGQNLQITYNNAPLVEDLQAFFDSPLDRVTTASILVRHFLPAYVILDAVYRGGSLESVVSTEIINYINNIDPDTAEIRTDLIKDAITRRGATTVDLPLTVIALFHGIDRRIRGMQSTKSIGINNTPFFKGEFLQTYFIAGPDTSKTSPRPTGEQVFLQRT